MSGPRRTKSAVPSTIASLNSIVSERLAELLDHDPEFRDNALEMGVIDHHWLEDPAKRPLTRVPPVEVMRRFLERAVERRPSSLARLGLSAVQVLAAGGGLVRGGDKQVTLSIVFTDLEGFTSFTAAHGDDAAIALLAEHHRVVGPIVRRWGGRVVKRLGDGLMLSFTDPQYAVRAAVELVEAPPDHLRLRAGVHTGPVVVTKDDLIGHAVNVAARITDVAKGGQVLVSQEVLDAAREISGVRLSKPSRKRVKGVREPVSVYRVSPMEPSGP